MRFNLLRGITDGKSLFSTLVGVGNPFHSYSCEREWKGNQPGESCVPEGFYILEPHNGTKYKNTFALIGDTVSHSSESCVPRYACVFHWSGTGAGLQGCVSLADSILYQVGKPARLIQDNSLSEFVALLKSEPGPHYLTITNSNTP